MKKKIEGIFVCTLLITMIPLASGVINISDNKLVDKYPFFYGEVSTFGDDVDDVGWYSSLALDDDGFPHVSYYDYGNGALKYAFWDGGVWNVEVVDSDGNVGRYTSIALDDDGFPHVSYYDYGNGALKYAFWDGSNWCIDKVDSSIKGSVGLYTCIALDSSDHPHISYCDYDKRTLNYAYWTGSSWHKQVVDDSAQMCIFEYFGDYTSIAIDSSDHPHISYCDYENYDLKYAHFTGSKWNIEVVDSEGYVGQYPCIALDEYDNPHISYGYLQDHSLAFDLKYASKTGAVWSVETVDKSGDVRKWTSLALDSFGFPHISYYDYLEGALKYAFYDGETWSFEAVETNGSTGCFNSLCLDSEDDPYISYYDWGNKALKYASSTDGFWEVQVIEVDTNNDYLDQEQNYCCGYADPIYDDEPLSQSFIPIYQVLTRVELMIVKRYNPDGFTVSVRSALDGEDLTSVYLSADEIAEDMAWKNFDFQDLDVTPGETYYIVCTSENTEDDNMYFWYFGIYDSYVDGCAWVFNNDWNVLTFGGGFPDVDLGFKTFGLNTNLPDKPTKPSGSTSGKINVEYTYNTSTTDPDGDQLFYFFDWGDGADSGWVGPHDSGDTAKASHTWTKKNSYSVKVKAKDTYGAESPWSDPLTVSMPRNRAAQMPFLSFLQRHPHMLPILRYLQDLQ